MSEFLSRRMARRPFWLLVLGNVLVAEVIQTFTVLMIHRAYAGKPLALIGSPLWIVFSTGILSALLYLPSFTAASWRLHDTGQSGTLAWVAFICKAGILAIGAVTGLASAGLYMQSAHPDGVASGAVATLGGFGGMFLVGGLLLWLAYLCAQPSNTGDWPSADDVDITPEPYGVIAASTSPRQTNVRRANPKTPRSFGRRGA